MPAVSPDGFKQTMRRFASGVTIVTMQEVTVQEVTVQEVTVQDIVANETLTHGITVSAFMSVSLTPPLVQVCIDKRAHSHARLLEAERYGVSILAQGQDRVSNHFAGFDDEFTPEFTELGGFPVIKGALGQIVCKMFAKVDAGDHTIFIGQIEQLDWAEREPLVYFNAKYRELS